MWKTVFLLMFISSLPAFSETNCKNTISTEMSKYIQDSNRKNETFESFTKIENGKIYDVYWANSLREENGKVLSDTRYLIITQKTSTYACLVKTIIEEEHTEY